ncbi:hypothetical protein [Bifidobacterium samirii]|uniref:Uncharacterized protein n=1 Tax=Bifidobacterium samirii TaxID=2306974 RepID=A0A430FUE4_9BIFI|nr:hypothetical protein [Bifidobacterium samirii]RSX56779.1 hypothetical protein D2E24_1069 [Bifidobacterium samirii]
MPKYEGITQYECDRTGCPVKEYVSPNETLSADWHDMTRIDRAGNEKKFLLCGTDYRDYQTLAENQDKDFDAWMQQGGK